MATTVHVYRAENGWTVRREGHKSSTVAATQKEAIEIARSIARDSAPSQMVVYDRDGAIRYYVTRGLPRVLDPPAKNGRFRKIEKAVGRVALERITSGERA